MTTMSDLAPELVGEILARVPITFLRAVRSTCKSWDSLSENLIFGKAVARKQLLGFMTMDYMLCSVIFDLQGVRNGFIDISLNEIERFNRNKIDKVFHCDGLVLCVISDHAKILVWNPYLAQTRLITPIESFIKTTDQYALGHDSNGNQKILKFSVCREAAYNYDTHYEIYDFSSDSWKVVWPLGPRDWSIPPCQCGLSLKGNTYFIASSIKGLACFLLCFDFTRERFGQLQLPFHTSGYPVTLSCAWEEQLAVLYLEKEDEILEIWVTDKIECNTVSWSKFFKVSISIKPFNVYALGFFIDEEKRVAAVFAQGKKKIERYLQNSLHHWRRSMFKICENWGIS
ncbi:F-box/kelch-repeat protein [Raphanus sativus]|nr:F-box/kelch-repeat protein At3g13680-like isoform X2 [Raphanus sativus]KAJ4894343.1 F-box/kelch-repeat protein [Raphanus sativus]